MKRRRYRLKKRLASPLKEEKEKKVRERFLL